MSPDLAVTLVYIAYALAVLLTFGAVLTWVERKQAPSTTEADSVFALGSRPTKSRFTIRGDPDRRPVRFGVRWLGTAFFFVSVDWKQRQSGAKPPHSKRDASALPRIVKRDLEPGGQQNRVLAHNLKMFTALVGRPAISVFVVILGVAGVGGRNASLLALRRRLDHSAARIPRGWASCAQATSGSSDRFPRSARDGFAGRFRSSTKPDAPEVVEIIERELAKAVGTGREAGQNNPAKTVSQKMYR